MDDIKNLRVTFSAEGSEFVFITSAQDLSNLLNHLRSDTVKFLNAQNSNVTSYLTFEEIRDWYIEIINPAKTGAAAIQVNNWRV